MKRLTATAIFSSIFYIGLVLPFATSYHEASLSKVSSVENEDKNSNTNINKNEQRDLQLVWDFDIETAFPFLNGTRAVAYCPDQWAIFVQCVITECANFMDVCPKIMTYHNATENSSYSEGFSDCQARENALCNTYSGVDCCMQECFAPLSYAIACVDSTSGNQSLVCDVPECEVNDPPAPLDQIDNPLKELSVEYAGMVLEMNANAAQQYCPGTWSDLVQCTISECLDYADACAISSDSESSVAAMKQATPSSWCEAIETSLCDRFGQEGCCMTDCVHELSDTFLCLAEAQGMENVTSTSSCDAPFCSTTTHHDDEGVTEGHDEHIDSENPVTCHSSCSSCERSNDWTSCLTCADEDVELVSINPDDSYHRTAYCPREGSCRSEFIDFEICMQASPTEECNQTCDLFTPRYNDDEDVCNALSAAFCTYPDCDCPYCQEEASTFVECFKKAPEEDYAGFMGNFVDDIEKCGPKPAECIGRQEDSDGSATDNNDTNSWGTTSAAISMINGKLSLIITAAAFLVATLLG